jgi:hypothetical protein
LRVITYVISQSTRDEIENAFSLASNSKAKKEFFKEVVEPAKVAAVKTFDPLLKPFNLELNDEDIFGDDLNFVRGDGSKIAIEYKLHLKTFHDPVWDISASEYCLFKYDQFYRYREKDTPILYERLITSFDETSSLGRKNLKAFDFSGESPKLSWEYLLFWPGDLKEWQEGSDYFFSITPAGEKLIVFSKNKARRKNLDKDLKKSYNTGVILGNVSASFFN